uniref:Uncharacterized protein n=1 Tax=viral metagenome TaxID=1070528 RepID=A0A6M3KDX6_9ZZZZ
MGYETLANMMEYNKEMEELGREEAMNPTECPLCGGALDENSKGDKLPDRCNNLVRRDLEIICTVRIVISLI